MTGCCKVQNHKHEKPIRKPENENRREGWGGSVREVLGTGTLCQRISGRLDFTGWIGIPIASRMRSHFDGLHRALRKGIPRVTAIAVATAITMLLVAEGAEAGAVDVVTLGGKEYRQARVVAVEGMQVVLTHAGGKTQVAWSDLSAETQLRLLKENVTELERAQGDLHKTKDEAKVLQQTTEQYRKNLVALGEDPAAEAKPVTPAASLPPLDKSTLVTSDQIVGHYRADVATADTRYRKKTFRLEGVVERLEKDLFRQTYQAVLKVPGKGMRLICVVKPPEAYTKVYSIRNGERMIGEGERLGKVTLMQAGDKIVFEGRCSGLKDETLHFDVTALAQP